ncbi:hypothetical protein K6W76_09610 [Burkholderia anthina]|uniref:hypothetical protein n=1 Tax=Burkholderia anthina TaxID=179879 RepID=UPI00158D7A63|nr:hypothetical protein [Burkholderia anthina]MBY4866764.1 hypothetical protein [Burkholderia anthina]
MRPTTHKHENAVEIEAQATVTNLSTYRARRRKAANTATQRAATNLEARHLQIASHLSTRLESSGQPAVAAALVLLRADGTLDSTSTGLEAEFIPFLVRGLTSLVGKLKSPRRPSATSPRQGGNASLAAITTIGFVAATYLNDYAWIDAALSVAAQVCAARMWGR